MSSDGSSVGWRGLLGSLQLPLVAVGAVLCLAAASSFASLLGATPEGDGFLHGGALLVSYAGAAAGYALLAAALAVPPYGGVGVRFSRGQRALFLVAAVAAVATVVLPLFALPLALDGDGTPVFYAWLAPTAVALLGVAAGLGWRGVAALRARG